MAKISARGDSAWMRWRGLGGAELLLTKKGRLLYKWAKGEGWNLLRRNVSEEDAAAEAERRGMKVPGCP